MQAKIAHIGCGAFHRAHQLMFTQKALEARPDEDWRYLELNISSAKSADFIKQLKAQDCSYHLLELDNESKSLKEIKAIKSAMHPLLDKEEDIVRALSFADLITLTITEKGYEKGLAGELIAKASLLRMKENKPFTVLSCDNSNHNGALAKASLLRAVKDANLSAWIEENVSFPSSMVDRIVPAMNENSFAQIKSELGRDDPCAVISESFAQWVIEDDFKAQRPFWEAGGALFVKDVAPYEVMKLRMLNGAHSFLAYVGFLSGFLHIDDCMRDESLKNAALSLILNEQKPTLSGVSVDLSSYAQSLITRFKNPNLHHKTSQIASDGSLKLPYRFCESIKYHLENQSSFKLLSLGVAAWARYVAGISEGGEKYEIADPKRELFAQKLLKHGLGMDYLSSLLEIEDIFKDLSKSEVFVNAVRAKFQDILDLGTKASLEKTLKQA